MDETTVQTDETQVADAAESAGTSESVAPGQGAPQFDPEEVREALEFRRQWADKNPIPEAEVQSRAEQLIHRYLTNPSTREILAKHYGLTPAQAAEAARAQEEMDPRDVKLARLEQQLQAVTGLLGDWDQRSQQAALEQSARAEVDKAEVGLKAAIQAVPGANHLQWLPQLYWAQCQAKGKLMTEFETRKFVKSHVDAYNASTSLARRRATPKALSGNGGALNIKSEDMAQKSDAEIAQMIAEQVGLK